MHSFEINKNIIIQNFSYSKLINFISHKNKILFSIDSRVISPGSIFIALKGDAKNGHDYILDALNNQAGLIIAERIPTHMPQKFVTDILCIPDTWEFFYNLARNHLQNLRLTKIGLSGSNGKTTTKNLIKTALEAHMNTSQLFVSAKNYNNHFGVPLSAFQITNTHKLALFELGMNHAGELAQLCSIIKPDLGVLTNIGPAHVGNFPDKILGVANAKGELFQALDNTGHGIINLDNKYILEQARKYNFNKQTTFGTHQDSDYRFIKNSNFDLENLNQTVYIHTPQGEISFELSLPGLHNAYNSVCALAVVGALGFDIKKSAQNLKNIEPDPGRMSITKIKNGAVLVNDSYNANPESFKSGVQTISQFPAARKIGVFGYMGELGPQSEQFHYELGKLAAPIFDILVICYSAAQAIISGACETGFNKKFILFFNSSEEAISPIKNIIGDQDLIFIKGSLSSKMGIISSALLEREQQA